MSTKKTKTKRNTVVIDKPAEESVSQTRLEQKEELSNLYERSSRKKRLMVGMHECSLEEEAGLRAAAVAWMASKGLRFNPASLTQDKLNEMLTFRTFLGRIGHLRTKI